MPSGTNATFSPLTSGGAATPNPTEERETEKYSVAPGPASSLKLIASITSPGSRPSRAALIPTTGGGSAGGGPCGMSMSPAVAGTAGSDADIGSSTND